VEGEIVIGLCGAAKLLGLWIGSKEKLLEQISKGSVVELREVQELHGVSRVTAESSPLITADQRGHLRPERLAWSTAIDGINSIAPVAHVMLFGVVIGSDLSVEEREMLSARVNMGIHNRAVWLEHYRALKAKAEGAGEVEESRPTVTPEPEVS
jgi:hypothetical protein